MTISEKQLDQEIEQHLNTLSAQQKQVVLVVLKTMSGQNNISDIDDAEIAANRKKAKLN